MFFLIGPRHPEGEQAQNPPCPLKARQALPLALKHGDERGVKWVAGQEKFFRGLPAQITQFGLMLPHPGPVFGSRFLAIFRQAIPIKQATADDLGHFRIRGHADRLAHPIQQLLVGIVVALIFGVHFQLGRGNGHAEHEVVTGASFFREVMEEIVELGSQSGPASTRNIVQQFIHQDDGRASGQHAPQGFSRWGDAPFIMLGDRRQGGFPAELPGDLAPGGFPPRFPFPAAPVHHVKFRSHKDRDRCWRNVLHVGAAEDAFHAFPALRRRATVGEMVERG